MKDKIIKHKRKYFLIHEEYKDFYSAIRLTKISKGWHEWTIINKPSNFEIIPDQLAEKKFPYIKTLGK